MGWLDFSRDVTKEVTASKAMVQALRNRGPDGEGFAFINETGPAIACKRPCDHGAPDLPGSDQAFFVGLGHRRLAIVELSELGHQPMSVAGGKYWIVYNGEIYNHADLAEELKRHGAEFAGHSDTEVLLHAFRIWGPECLSRLNGMFSFVIVDHVQRRIFAARDRFGIKPLFYGELTLSAVVIDRFTFDVLHRKPGRTVLADTTIDQMSNIGVFEIGKDLTFPAKALDHGGRGQLVMDELDGDGHLQLVIIAFGVIDRTHAAASNFPINQIGTDTAADRTCALLLTICHIVLHDP